MRFWYEQVFGVPYIDQMAKSCEALNFGKTMVFEHELSDQTRANVSIKVSKSGRKPKKTIKTNYPDYIRLVVPQIPVDYAVADHTLRNQLYILTERLIFHRDETTGRLELKIEPVEDVFKNPYLRQVMHTINALTRNVFESSTVNLPWTRQQVVDASPVYNHARYERSNESFRLRPFNHFDDSTVKPFSKPEKKAVKYKWIFDHVVQEQVLAPAALRDVLARDTRFLIVSGCFFKPIEPITYEVLDELFITKINKSRTRSLMKGLNADERGRIIAEKCKAFGADFEVVTFDCTHYDKFQSAELMKHLEHKHYLSCYKGQDKQDFRDILHSMLNNRIRAETKDGYVVKCESEGRMTGDVCTSLGNIFNMCVLMATYVSQKRLCGQVDFVDDGDDCFLIGPRGLSKKITDISQFFRNFGLILRIEDVVHELEHILFCQSKPVLTAAGTYRMIRDPRTSMAKDATCLLKLRNQKHLDGWRHGVSSGGKILTAGTPVGPAYYTMLGRGAKYEGIVPEFSKDMEQSGLGRAIERMNTQEHSYDLPMKVRISFFRAFGMLPSDQIAFEKYLLSREPNFVYFQDRVPPEIRIGSLPDLTQQHILFPFTAFSSQYRIYQNFYEK